MPQIDQNDNEKIVLKYAEAVEWYFKKIKTQLHSNMQEAKRCGDLETCTDFVISGLTNEKKDGSVVIKFDSFFRNKLAEDKLGNQIGEDIWDYDPDKLTDAVVYYIVDPDQRYLKNEIFRHSKSRDASNCGWKPVSWKKNGDFGLCYTGEKWKTTKTKWNDVAEKCKSKRLNDCRCFIESSNQDLQKNYYSEKDYCDCPEYRIDQNIVREDKYRCKKCDQIDITIKPDTELLKLNTNYTYYAEMIIQLDDDKCKQDLSGQQGCRLTVRSEHRHFLTDSGMANPVQNLVIKEKKAPENNGTKYLVHFDPPVSSTGHLKNFISLAKVSINRKDDQSSTLSAILKNSNFKEESESQFDYLSLNPTCSWAGQCRTGCCDDFKKLLDKYSSEHQQDFKERTSGGKKSVLPRSGGYGFGSDQRGNSRAPGACSETKDKKMQDLKNFVSKRSVKINAYSGAQIENESSSSSDGEENFEGGQLKAEIPSDTTFSSSSESSVDDLLLVPTSSNETEKTFEEYVDWMEFDFGQYGDDYDCDGDYDDCGSENIDTSSEIPKIEDIPPKCVLQRFICDDLLSPKGHDYGLEDNCTQIFEIKSENEKSDYFLVDDETEIIKEGETKLLYKCSEYSNATSVPLPKTNLTVANQKISLMDMYFIHQCVQCYKDIESLEWPRKTSSPPDDPLIMPSNETFDSFGERKRRSPTKDDEQQIIVEDVDRYNLAKVIKKYMTVSENPYDRDKNPQALFENLIPGKRYDFEVYACNENVPGNTFRGTKDIMHDVACGKPQILHTLIKMATDIRNTSNLIQEKVEEILQAEKEKIQSPRAKMDTRLTNPQNSNDRPRLLPRILDSELRIQPKKGYKLPNSVHDFRLIFRSPDWVKQNGNVLVYIIVFAREDHDDMNKIILTDEAALGNLNAYLSNHTDFCKNFIKMNNIQKNDMSKELNLEDIDCTSKEPQIQKYSNSNKNSKFLKKPEKCYFERDPDKCGFRMISYSDIKGGASEPMEHFYEEGKKYELKDFRVLTSGILRSVLKPEDVVEDILKDECVKCKRSVSQYYYPYYSQENDPEIEQLKMEFEVTTKKWVKIVVSISLVLFVVCGVVYRKTFQKEEKQKAMLETTNPDFFDQFRGGNEYYYADDSTNQIHEQYLDCNIYSDDSVLGGGHFGKVYIGDLRIEHFRDNNLKAPLMDDCSDECLETCECKCENKIIKVAVKVAKGALTGQDDRLFFREQGMLNKFGSQGFHTISYYGWSYLPGDDGLARHCLVMEYISGKDLLNWLRKRNTNRKSFVFKSVPQATKEEGDKVTLKRLMKFCADIADGMCYLSKFAVVHRDLAARNCLVQINENEYETIKICDFGMMRELQIQTTDYYKCAENTDLPLKWCAPESLENKKFSIESDVWSYGVLLFEIATLGELPYYTLPDSQIRVKLTEHKKGGFNEFNCLYLEDWRSLITSNLRTYGILEDQLSDLIILIKACCNYEQDKRPKFDKIMEIMIGQQFQQLWTSDDNIHPLQDEPYKSTFFFFNTPDHEELNAEDASTVDTEDESRASITDKTPLIRNDDVRRASKFEEVSNHIGLPTVSWTSSK